LQRFRRLEAARRSSLNIRDPSQTPRSFCHTLIDDLEDAGVQDSFIKRVVGHKTVQ
jgi:hypothetical protein